MTAPADPLLRAFPPQFASYALGLQQPRAEAVPLTELLAPEGLEHLIARFGASLGSSQRRAVLSFWVQRYLLVVVPPAIATALLTRRQTAWDLRTAAVTLSHDAAPLAVCLPEMAMGGLGATPMQRLLPLFQAHLVPLAESLARGGLPRPVFWSNVAHVMAWTLDIVQACPDAIVALADQLDTLSNLGPPLRLARQGKRGVCCLRFRLPGLDRCAACPVGCRAF